MDDKGVGAPTGGFLSGGTLFETISCENMTGSFAQYVRVVTMR